MECNFLSSKRLQQNAILHIINEASNTEQINTVQTTNSFLHKNECKSEKPLRGRLYRRKFVLNELPYKEDLVRRTRSGRVYGIRDSQ